MAEHKAEFVSEDEGTPRSLSVVKESNGKSAADQEEPPLVLTKVISDLLRAFLQFALCRGEDGDVPFDADTINTLMSASASRTSVAPEEPAEVRLQEEMMYEGKHFSQIVSRIIWDRVERPRAQPVGAVPKELFNWGMTTELWLALAAPERHYIKRRVGKYKAKRLILNALQYLLSTIYDKLWEAGIDTSTDDIHDEIRDAVRGSMIIATTWFEHNEEEWRSC